MIAYLIDLTCPRLWGFKIKCDKASRQSRQDGSASLVLKSAFRGTPGRAAGHEMACASQTSGSSKETALAPGMPGMPGMPM